MSYECDDIKTLAAELGITAECIYKWRREFCEPRAVSFPGHGVECLSDEGRGVNKFEYVGMGGAGAGAPDRAAY